MPDANDGAAVSVISPLPRPLAFAVVGAGEPPGRRPGRSAPSRRWLVGRRGRGRGRRRGDRRELRLRRHGPAARIAAARPGETSPARRSCADRSSGAWRAPVPPASASWAPAAARTAVTAATWAAERGRVSLTPAVRRAPARAEDSGHARRNRDDGASVRSRLRQLVEPIERACQIGAGAGAVATGQPARSSASCDRSSWWSCSPAVPDRAPAATTTTITTTATIAAIAIAHARARSPRGTARRRRRRAARRGGSDAPRCARVAARRRGASVPPTRAGRSVAPRARSRRRVQRGPHGRRVPRTGLRDPSASARSIDRDERRRSRSAS